MSGLSERDVCTKFITPALTSAGWDLHTQIREEVSFTKGRIIVRGRLVTRGKAKRADYILYYRHIRMRPVNPPSAEATAVLTAWAAARYAAAIRRACC